MISIITAIRNQLPMNRLYLECLNKYTKHPFELIIINNGSTDGSADFFEEQGATVITNKENYSYPHCQNQGIEKAKYEVLAFFNNDLIVSPGWDDQLLKVMKQKELGIVSPATNDRAENNAETFRLRRKWNRIKLPLQFLFGTSSASLKWMHQLMYGNWEKWTSKRREQFGDQLMEGFSGSCIVASRHALNIIGIWDERIQSADFDLYLRTKKRSMEQGDIKPAYVLLGVYFHHYGRLTLEGKNYTPFADQAKLISCEEKWGDEMKNLLSDINT